jgi:hypothetical protein
MECGRVCKIDVQCNFFALLMPNHPLPYWATIVSVRTKLPSLFLKDGRNKYVPLQNLSLKEIIGH